jgi:predicted esterase
MIWTLGVALALASGVPAPLSPPAGGQVSQRVVVAADPTKSYALFVPAGASLSSRAPIVYVLDARGRATLALDRFRPAAERFGWIVASAYDSASDGPVQVTIDALRALWSDTHARLPLDSRRVYLAGFSGTARTACYLAALAPGSVAGVIGAGAGFPTDGPPSAATSFPFYGVVGDRDFNHDELAVLDETLAALDKPHRIEVFEGAHEWPPPEEVERALLWFEMQAQRRGLRPTDRALIREFWSKERARAARASSEGRLAEAQRLYEALARELAGLHDVSEAARDAARLTRDPAVAEERRAQRERRHADTRFLARARDLMAAADPADARAVRDLVQALEIDRLRELALRTDADGRSAARRLATLAVQTGFYLPEARRKACDFRQAAFFLDVATHLQPEDARTWLRLAGARSRARLKGPAVEALRRAIDLGWTDPAPLEGEAFEAVRAEPAFQELRMRLISSQSGVPS